MSLLPTPYASNQNYQKCKLNTVVEMNLVNQGDKVVITSGVPVGKSGTTSLIKVHSIGQPITAEHT
nr:pyruvate kinase alpha/beta domain-containing protein [Cylindrospermum stagnale]